MDYLIAILFAVIFSTLIAALMCWGVEKRAERFDVKSWNLQIDLNKLNIAQRDILESRIGKLEARLGGLIADSNDFNARLSAKADNFHARLDELEKQNLCKPKKKSAKA